MSQVPTQAPEAAKTVSPEAVATRPAEITTETPGMDGKKLEVPGAKVEEAPKEEVAKPKEEEKPEDKRFASKFAALSKKEKAIVDRELKLKAREKEIEAKYSTATSFQDKLLADPITVLKENLGDNWYQNLTNLVVRDGKKGPEWEIAQLKRQMAAEKEEQAKSKAAEEEKLRAQAEENVKAQQKQVLGQIGKLITQGGERFELTANHPEGAELVFNTIESHYHETAEAGEPKILSYEEAADAVEKYLEEEALKWAKLKKLQGKLTPAQEKAKSEGAPAPANTPKADAPKTLTNSMETQAPTPKDMPVFSVEDSKKRAAQLLKWN
jgi:hypothetical protein